jgi:hypothetical protein
MEVINFREIGSVFLNVFFLIKLIFL